MNNEEIKDKVVSKQEVNSEGKINDDVFEEEEVKEEEIKRLDKISDTAKTIAFLTPKGDNPAHIFEAAKRLNKIMDRKPQLVNTEKLGGKPSYEKTANIEEVINLKIARLKENQDANSNKNKSDAKEPGALKRDSALHNEKVVMILALYATKTNVFDAKLDHKFNANVLTS